MKDAPYRAARVSEIETVRRQDGEAPWDAVRAHFGMASFGMRHEELFFMASGHALFTVDDETVGAPAGTFVYVRDPAPMRGASARGPGTTVLAVYGERGRPFEVSPREEPYQHGG